MRTLYPTHSQLYLGQGWALYCGPIQHLDTHIYGADVLHVGIYQPFRLRWQGSDWLDYRSLWVPAGTPHALDIAGGVHGKLFVEKDHAVVSGHTASSPLQNSAVLEGFRWIYESDPPRDAVARWVEPLLNSMAQQHPQRDQRIRRIVEFIEREPDRNIAQEELARLVGLSPSRFLHLFRAEIGLPYRRFRTWKRMMAAFALLHETDSLTRAALDAGFADATHFSHRFRDTFGTNPAPVFRKLNRFER